MLMRIGSRAGRRRLRQEDGFTLVELMVASGIILVALMLLAYTATVVYADVAMARQRQGATGLANRTMEQVRALPFDTLQAGLSTNDLAGAADPAITSGCGAPYCYGGERIPTHSGLGSVVPLEPHRQSVAVGGVSYTIAVYPAYFENDQTTNAFRVTVVVTWANPARRTGAALVRTQSVFYSPSGCQSTQTHPLAAPCQPYLYGAASAEPTRVGISGAGAATPILGIDLDNAAVSLPAYSSSMEIEQTAAVQGRAQASGVTLQLQGQAAVTGGGQVAQSGADNDPSQPKPLYDSQPLGPQAAGVVSASDAAGRNSLTLTAGAGDDGTSTSTVAAGTANPCLDVNGNNQTDTPAQPCGSATATQRGAASAALRLWAGSTDLGDAVLANLAAGGNKGVAATDRALAAEPAPISACTATPSGSDGCLHAAAARAVGALQLGGLPSSSAVAKPSGWTGYLVSVAGYADTVVAESGVGSAAPQAPAPSDTATVTYFDGTGYRSQRINVPNVTIVPMVSVSDPLFPGGALTITVTGTLTTGSRTTAAPATGCTTGCEATATSSSPLSGDLTYTVVHNGVTLADLNLHVDYGTLLAKASYTEAPSGA
jgi:prepilin-type N-terminal cleavage/methylation domain-containing protein